MIKITVITSPSNKIIKYIKSLHSKKGREKTSQFLIEGERNVLEAIENAAEIEKIIVSETKKNFLNKFKNKFKKDDFIVLSESNFKKISDTKTPQGIAAICKIKNYSLEKIITKDENMFIAVDFLQDPGNMGTIIRTAAAAGLSGVIVNKGSVDPYSPKVVRASMGSIFQIPIMIVEDLAMWFETIKKSFLFKIVVADINTDKFFFEADLKGNTVIVVGNENKGPSQKVLDIADVVVKIPLLGKTESLNAGVAAGILIYEGVRQKLYS